MQAFSAFFFFPHFYSYVNFLANNNSVEHLRYMYPYFNISLKIEIVQSAFLLFIPSDLREAIATSLWLVCICYSIYPKTYHFDIFYELFVKLDLYHCQQFDMSTIL